MKKNVSKFLIAVAAMLCFPLAVSAEDVCDHQWSNWEVSYNATCTDDGYETRTCSKCYDWDERKIPATGIHKWSDWEVEYEATCAENGSMRRECSECYKDEWKDIPATGVHNWSNWEVYTAPDCLNDGESYRTCKDCYKEQTKVIPKNPKAHDWSKWYAVKGATVFKKGKQERSCYVCMKEETKAIAKLKPFAKFPKKTVSLKKSQKQTLKVSFAKGDSVKSWKSSNKKVATV